MERIHAISANVVILKQRQKGRKEKNYEVIYIYLHMVPRIVNVAT